MNALRRLRFGCFPMRSCMSWRGISAPLVATIGVGALPGAAVAQSIERVSISSSGDQGDSYSTYPSISADGRFVAFTSYALNFGGGSTYGISDVFVHDRQTGVTQNVSFPGGLAAPDGNSDSASISADGRFVAFASAADNLVPDGSSFRDIFVYDRQTGLREIVTVGANANSAWPSISGDGRFVAFLSAASNLAGGPNGDTNGTWDIFVRDRQARSTERVSVSSSGEQANNLSWFPSISANGRFVVFLSQASNLVPRAVNPGMDVFVHDRETGETTWVSVCASDPNCGGGGLASGHSYVPSISADGRFVAFSSDASDFVPNDTNGKEDVFVHDRETAQTTRVSVSSTGEEGNGYSGTRFVGGGQMGATISGDGRFVAFASTASNLVPDDTNQLPDVFVHDRQTGETRRVSVACSGAQLDDSSAVCRISADGRFVAFHSLGSNIIPSDTNDTWDVFVCDREGVPPVPCTGDIDGDCATDVLDFSALVAGFGIVVVPGSGSDLNDDGEVNVFDFAIFAADFGCEP